MLELFAIYGLAWIIRESDLLAGVRRWLVGSARHSSPSSLCAGIAWASGRACSSTCSIAAQQTPSRHSAHSSGLYGASLGALPVHSATR